MVLGTSLVVFQGLPALESTEEQQISENSRNAVLLIQDRIGEMVQRDVPRREVSINVQDLTVGVGGMEPTQVSIEATNSSGSTVPIADVETDPVYIETTVRTFDQSVAYENGAVVFGQRDVPESWTMTSRPSWAITTNKTTDEVRSVFLRTVSTKGSGSVTGQATSARLVFEKVSSEIDSHDDVDELELSVESPRSGSWRGYFERLNASVAGGEVTSSGDEVTLVFDEFAGGEGSVTHRTQVISVEVTSR
ncbi:MAG: hypothetical protein U5J64_06160 [Halobacteriales archaeon]|nr:hypothetical protein [Halobacteriales archaeon]